MKTNNSSYAPNTIKNYTGCLAADLVLVVALNLNWAQTLP